MEDKEPQPHESFAIINRMIDEAKHKLADDGFHFILWGWLITCCALFNYAVLKISGAEFGYYIWMVLPPLGAIASMYYGYKSGKKKTVTTHLDTYLAYLWGAFIIALVITLGFMPLHGFKHSYFFIMLLYGIASFVTGGLLNFKPLIVGSLFSFAIAALSVFVSSIDQFLCLSLALIFSYIIPGHLLRSAYKSQNV